MKKNVMMRLASGLLIAVLLTTCAIAGTFAKYTTRVDSNDNARVAYWGFQPQTITITDLFRDTYNTNKIDSVGNPGEDVIAPGASGTASFAFIWDDATSVAVTGPEVAYTFEVSVSENCDPRIKANKNIQWSLDGVACSSWDEMIAKIKLLSGEPDGICEYSANSLPPEFNLTKNRHVISWEWLSTGAETYTVGENNLTQDQYDTYMGNMDTLDEVSISITITATQID